MTSNNISNVKANTNTDDNGGIKQLWQKIFNKQDSDADPVNPPAQQSSQPAQNDTPPSDVEINQTHQSIYGDDAMPTGATWQNAANQTGNGNQ